MKKSGNVTKPADKSKKKLTPAEQAKLDEEIKARQEKRAEENRQFGIKMAVDGVPLLLTSDFLDKAWDSDKPREFVYNYLERQFDRIGLLYQIKPEEQKMYANQILLDLIFLRKDLTCEGEKLQLLTNLLFSNFTNKDKRFQGELPLVQDTPPETEEEEEALVQHEQKFKSQLPEMDDSDEPEDYRSQLNPSDSLEEKTYEGDLSDFKSKLGAIIRKYSHHFTDKAEIAKYVSHAMGSYFSNFNLFRCTSMFRPSEEHISMQVSVDEPSDVQPLSAATQVSRLEEETAHEHHGDTAGEDEKKKAEEAAVQTAEMERIEEEERKKQEEWMGLDEKTIAMIQERLTKTKEHMLQRIEAKKEEYAEKLAAAKIQIKKK